MTGMRRWRVWLVMLGLIVLLPVGAVWYLAWQGEREWEATRKELVAKGEKLTVTELAPGPVADERNFFGDAMWKEIAETGFGFSADGHIHFRPAVQEAHQQLGVLEELISKDERNELVKAWPRFVNKDLSGGRGMVLHLLGYKFRARDEAWRDDWAGLALAMLRPDGPVLKKTGELLQRPEARFPIEYRDDVWTRTPHMQMLENLARTLQLRAQAEIQQRKSSEARLDVLTGLALAHTLRDDLLMDCYLKSLYLAYLPLKVIDQGIWTHAWTAGDLEEFERALRGEDLLPGFIRVLRGQRAVGGGQQIV